MKTAILLLLGAAACAQNPGFRPLHVSSAGMIVDDSGKAVALRGLNRSGTGSGNAEATSTDAEYAAQNQLLSMNLVRIFVNASWWNSNVQVPIAGAAYQTYIDQLIQRAKKYGNYVVILKAGQFPDPPCGADGKNCPAPNQGDLNCQANAAVCLAQDTTGNSIDTAFTFWGAFARKYAGDPAVLYDTWEDMHGIDSGTWSNNQNQLIAAIRTYNPQALIFVEDTGTAFESILSGSLPDFAWSNLVWNFHLYAGPSGTCTTPASARYANWPQNFDPLVSFAQKNGHAVAITEWGSCNDSEPYRTNITSYARAHSVALAYFDSTVLLASSGGSFQLTATGSEVAQAYSAIAAGGPAGPVISLVANAEGEAPLIAPNTWVEIKGSNLAPAGDVRIWQSSDFVSGQMPTQLDGVKVTVNGKSAFVYYISPTQVNVLTPPDAMQGAVQVQLTNGQAASPAVTVQAQAVSPSFFIFGAGPYVAAEHSNGSYLGPATLYPGQTTPAKPGETIVLFANGFGPTSLPIVGGSPTQGGTIAPLPTVTIGGLNATVTFAGLIFPGEFQLNVVVPSALADGDHAIIAYINGASTQPGALLTVQGAAAAPGIAYTLSPVSTFATHADLAGYGFSFGPSDGQFGAIPGAGGTYTFYGDAGGAATCVGSPGVNGEYSFTGTLDRITGSNGCKRLFGPGSAPAGWVFDQNYAGGGQVVPFSSGGKTGYLIPFHGEYWWQNPNTPTHKCDVPGGNGSQVNCFYSSLGLAVSTDNGKTFQVAGQLLQPSQPLSIFTGGGTNMNVGYGSLVVADAGGKHLSNPPPDPRQAYFYLFYTDYLPGLAGPCANVPCIGVARAVYADVVTAALSGDPHQVARVFHKYDGGSPDPWTQPATSDTPDLSGTAGKFAPLWTDDAGGQPEVIYDAAFDLYLAVHQTSAGLAARASTDLIHWSGPIGPAFSEPGHTLYYVTILGENGDPNTAGTAPRIYFSSFPTGQFPDYTTAVFESVTLNLSRQ